MIINTINNYTGIDDDEFRAELIDGVLAITSAFPFNGYSGGLLGDLGTIRTRSEETKTIETTQTIEVEKVTETPVTG